MPAYVPVTLPSSVAERDALTVALFLVCGLQRQEPSFPARLEATIDRLNEGHVSLLATNVGLEAKVEQLSAEREQFEPSSRMER